jgi:hypothetical protein
MGGIGSRVASQVDGRGCSRVGEASEADVCEEY